MRVEESGGDLVLESVFFFLFLLKFVGVSHGYHGGFVAKALL
jgi:hypothetical protein